MRNPLLKVLIAAMILCFSTILTAQSLNFLVTKDYAPLSFEEKGVLKGLTVDIVKEIAEETGCNISMTSVTFEDAYKKIQGDGNYAIPTFVFTGERKSKFQWVGPLAITKTYLYSRNGLNKEILTIEDAKNVEKIGVVKDYYSHQLLESQGFNNLVIYNSEEFLLRALINEKVDLAPFNEIVLENLLESCENKAELTKTIIIDLDMTFIGFSSDVPEEVVNKWQAALDKMKESDELEKIYRKWLPGIPVPGKYTFLTEEYPPVTYTGNNGEITGFVTDIVKEIMRRNEMEEDIFLVPWNIGFNLAKNLPNVILFSIDRTPQREELFNWIGPVGKNTTYFYSLRSKDIQLSNVDDAKKINTIATTDDWWTEQLLKDLGF
ncbi:MAG: transporter substrate-binding domain-containing protein, partial [Thermotogota bacterium]|nr:transporter substrate-binding domain-containing protein [Thermotogota bacterium]